MQNSKTFYRIMRGSTLLIWLFLIVLVIVGENNLSLVAGIAFVVLFFIHLAELPISLSIGREKNLGTGTVVIKTLVFGFTWWLPLRKGMINE